MTIFKNSRLDVLCILYVIVVALIPFWLATLDWIWWLVALPVHQWLICNLQNGALHHHGHWGTFTSRLANRCYDVILSGIGGLSCQIWRASHHIHHKWVNDKPVNGTTKDFVSVFRHGIDSKPENFYLYCWRGTLETMPPKFFIPKNMLKGIFNRKWLLAEYYAWTVYMLILAAYSWEMALWMYMVYFIAHFFNKATSYGEHWQVLDRRGDTTQDSIGVYSKWYNWLSFNEGYHQEHHNQPAMHWTKLPELTPSMHPDRVIIKSMHIFNNPWWTDLKTLLRKKQA